MIEPSWPEILNAAITKRLRGVHTAIPAKVVSYANGLAVVEPSVQVEIDEDTFEALPAISDVPVLQPQGGGYFAHFPVTAGDHVLLIFSEQDPSAWFDKGTTEPPPFQRRHGFYPFAVLGGFPRSDALSAPAGKLTVGKQDGPTITVDGSHVILGDPTATDFAALASKVKAALDIIKSHEHVSAAPGSPTAPGPTLSTIDSDVAASKVKVK